MKKILLSIVCTLSLLGNISLAQYGGGGSAYSNYGGGYPSYALSRDICSNGDRSPSFYDGTCGDTLIASEVSNQDLLVTGPSEVKKVLHIPENTNIIVVQDDNLITPDFLPETGVSARSAKRVLRLINSHAPTEIVNGLVIPSHLPETGAGE